MRHCFFTTSLFTTHTAAQGLLGSVESTSSAEPVIGRVILDETFQISDDNIEDVRLASIKVVFSDDEVTTYPNAQGRRDEEIFAMTLLMMGKHSAHYTQLKTIWVPRSGKDSTAVYWFFYIENDLVDPSADNLLLPVSSNANAIGGLEVLYNASFMIKDRVGHARRAVKRLAFSTEATGSRVHNAQGERLGDIFAEATKTFPECEHGCELLNLSWEIEQGIDQRAIFWFEFVENDPKS